MFTPTNFTNNNVGTSHSHCCKCVKSRIVKVIGQSWCPVINNKSTLFIIGEGFNYIVINDVKLDCLETINIVSDNLIIITFTPDKKFTLLKLKGVINTTTYKIESCHNNINTKTQFIKSYGINLITMTYILLIFILTYLLTT